MANLNRSLRAINGAAEKQRVRDAEKAMAERQKFADSFANFAQNLGLSADNPLSSSTYAFNPITRNRVLLEWMHRGSWLAGKVVDDYADDMTREGVSVKGELEAEDVARLAREATRLGVWVSLRDTVAWSRLYGGALAFIMVEGQDASTSFDPTTVDKGQFKGLLVLDRWMVEASLSELVSDFCPEIGKPMYYHTRGDTAIPKLKIHYTRIVRLEGVHMPYWQSVTEGLWGISVLERLYDRMIAFDSATTGAAQLVYKAYIRTYKIKNLREIVAMGGDAQVGLQAYVDFMRRYQGIEGVTLMDSEDEFEGHSHTAFGGLSDALVQFSQQLSGAAGIPLVRLFGQSPAGFNSGDSDLRNYYDTIKQQQEKDLHTGVRKVYVVMCRSLGIEVPEDFDIKFNSLWQMTDKDKSEIATSTTSAVVQAKDAGLISEADAARELRQSSDVTGIFTNISDADINDLEASGPPLAKEMNLQSEETQAESEQKRGLFDRLFGEKTGK